MGRDAGPLALWAAVRIPGEAELWSRTSAQQPGRGSWEAPEGRVRVCSVGPRDGGHNGSQTPRGQLGFRDSFAPTVGSSSPGASISLKTRGPDLPEQGLFCESREPRAWPSGLGWRALGFPGALHSPFKLQGCPASRRSPHAPSLIPASSLV